MPYGEIISNSEEVFSGEQNFIVGEAVPQKHSRLASLGDSPRCGEMSAKQTEGTASVRGGRNTPCFFTSFVCLYLSPTAAHSFAPARPEGL